MSAPGPDHGRDGWALALALRQRDDPAPPGDLARRARARAEAAEAFRLARTRARLRRLEVAAAALIALVVAAGALGLGAPTSGPDPADTGGSDPWGETLWLAGAGCVAALAYAVLARAEGAPALEPLGPR
jgi:hypothetical protein